MENGIFIAADLADVFKSISDEQLIHEVAQRMVAKPDFYDKTCTSKALQEAINQVERRIQIAA